MLTCCVCGSPDWMAVSPGTEAEATRFLDQAVMELRRADAVPTRAFCADHWRQSWVAVAERPDETEVPVEVDDGPVMAARPVARVLAAVRAEMGDLFASGGL